MSKVKPYSESEAWSLYKGDCLDVMPALQARTAKLVLTDPPYMIGAASVAGKAPGQSWHDLMNAARWYSDWMAQAIRLLPENGFLAAFLNWRSIPIYIRALSMLDRAWTSCLVWDKQWTGPAHKHALRTSWEAVMVHALPSATIPDRTARDVVACKWMATHSRKFGHPAEKPVELLRWIIERLTYPGDLVVDCFAGSGSTLQAAIETQRQALGIEIEEKWIKTCINRLSTRQGYLFDEIN